MNILSWILFGLVVGIVANTIDTSSKRASIIGSTLLGVVGALLGGFLTNLLFGIAITNFNLAAFSIAIVGSLLLISFGKAVRRT